jgi:tetratricopeptide (TPR) repeat protein
VLLGVLILLAGCRSAEKNQDSEVHEKPVFENASIAPGPCPTATGGRDAIWCGEPRHNRALERFHTRDFGATISLCTRALEEMRGKKARGKKDASEEVRLLTLRGLARAAVHDRERANDDFTLALEVDPENVEALFARGTERLVAGDSAGAIADLSAVIRFSPECWPAFVNRGNAHAAGNDLQRALVDHAAAIELAPKRAQTWRNRGLVRMELGDREGAAEDFQRALELEPGDKKTRTRLNRLKTS